MERTYAKSLVLLVRIVAPDDHPNPSEIGKSGTNYILEHRLIMEQSLGRYLLQTEVVHHIDGNPSNNDIANLRLYQNQSSHISKGHGKG